MYEFPDCIDRDLRRDFSRRSPAHSICDNKDIKVWVTEQRILVRYPHRTDAGSPKRFDHAISFVNRHYMRDMRADVDRRYRVFVDVGG